VRLLVARHGEAMEAASDSARPLSERGREAVERVGAAVAADGLRVTRVTHSGLKRAEETAVILARLLAPDAVITVDPRLEPDEDPSPIVESLFASDQDTLVVGHLPYVARLALRLLRDPKQAAMITFRPGTLMVLERDPHGAWTRVATYQP